MVTVGDAEAEDVTVGDTDGVTEMDGVIEGERVDVVVEVTVGVAEVNWPADSVAQRRSKAGERSTEDLPIISAPENNRNF